MNTTHGSEPAPDASDAAAGEILSQIPHQIAAVRAKVQRAWDEVSQHRAWLPEDDAE